MEISEKNRRLACPTLHALLPIEIREKLMERERAKTKNSMFVFLYR